MGYFHADMRPSEFLATWLENEFLSGEERKTFEAYYISYRNGYSELMRSFYDRRMAEALGIVAQATRPLRVLDIGTGCGSESLIFALKGCRVTGIDIVVSKLDTAAKRKEILEAHLGHALDCEFLRTDLLKFEPAEPFDLIWMEEAFHHIEPRAQVVRKIRELLAPGGHLVIAETNALNPLVQLRMLIARGFRTVIAYPEEGGQVRYYGNERILPACRLVKWFRREGLSPVVLKYFRFMPARLSLLRPFAGMDRLLDRWLPLLFKRVLCVHYNYVGVAGPSRS